MDPTSLLRGDRRDAQAKEAVTIDDRLAATEKLLARPIPKSLAAVAKSDYRGPDAGLVNCLLDAALRVARGAVEDGAGLAVLVATPFTPQKKRDADPRVVEVMDVARRVLELETESTLGRDQVTCLLLGVDEDMFSGEWSHHGILSVVRTYAREAPDDTVLRMLVSARELMVSWAKIDRQMAADEAEESR
jgi:hypothetical protein